MKRIRQSREYFLEEFIVRYLLFVTWNGPSEWIDHPPLSDKWPSRAKEHRGASNLQKIVNESPLQSRFFAPSVPCSDPFTMIPWILNEFRVSLLGSRYRAFFFLYGREKIREDTRKRNVQEETVAIRWNDYTRSRPDATTFKIWSFKTKEK